MEREIRNCQNCKTDFTIEPEDFQFYEMMKVPSPTFCPTCRMQRRMMFRNEHSLYKRNCDKCGKSMITMFSPDKPHKVYCSVCWWSDNWDPMDQGRDYDPKRPFFEQLKELLLEAPMMGLSCAHTTLVDSDYINEASFCKNCYLVFNSDYCENSMYGTSLSNTKDVMDTLLIGESELCYEAINCGKCFNCVFSEDLTSCHDVYFSKNLVGCDNCFGCINLRNKSYHIWNKPYSKEDYQNELSKLKRRMSNADELSKLLSEAEEFWQRSPQKYMHGLQNSNVVGDYVYYSKNSKEIYQSRYVEDSKYVQLAKDKTTKNCYDYTVWGANCERVYEAITCGENAQNIKFGVVCPMGTNNLEYSLYCYSSSDLFGCVSVRKKSNCILNKQYTENEYRELKEKIMKDMEVNPYIDQKGRVWKYGEFFPYDLCPFAYNESIALEYVPIDKEKALEMGLGWSEPKVSEYAITMKGSDLPKTSVEITEDILKEVISCDQCSRAYRFTKNEIDLLRKMEMPLPGICWECRHRRRFARLNLPKFWKRKCAKCGSELETCYGPDRPETIYCEACYQAEVV